MIIVAIGTAIGTLLAMVAGHYIREWLRRVVKKNSKYKLPKD